MKHKLLLPLLSFVPLLLTSCDIGSGKKGEYVPRAINLTERIYAGAGKIRVLGADFVSAFNTSISGTLYLLKNAQTDESAADIIIVNTCCFIHDAKEESIQTILEMARYKNTGKLKALIITGCLAERYKDEILQEIPEVDALLGTAAFTEILQVN